jgi:hypothetical protein
LARAPFVARDDELAHLLGEPWIVTVRLRRREQLGDLCIDVERRLAAASEPTELPIAGGGEPYGSLSPVRPPSPMWSNMLPRLNRKISDITTDTATAPNTTIGKALCSTS